VTIEKYREALLSALLDKYEAGSFFRTGTKPSRRIMLRLYDGGVSDFPVYEIEKPEIRETINKAVLSLHEKGLVLYQWMKGEDHHILARVWINFENIGAAYSYINRKPANDTADEACLELLDALEKVKSGWIKDFLTDSYEKISQRRSIGTGSREEQRNLIRALVFTDQMGETELLERVFSLQCFGDSKTFENTIRKRFLDIIKRYSDCDDDSTSEELLHFAGIAKYPEQFEFRGPLAIHFEKECGGSSVDFSPLRAGASLSSGDLKRGSLSIGRNSTRIISIENRANYIDYIHHRGNEDELAVYHGGCYSPAKGFFLKTLAAAMPSGCSWYHWGDIDYGGFSMLARLRREISKEILPYRMDQDELIRYAQFTAPLTQAYIERLRLLLKRDELTDCFSCINYMINNRVKLEQEAML
jgi:hypothetical protein